MENLNRNVESISETKEEVMANLGLSPEVKEQKSNTADEAEDVNEELEPSKADEEDVTDDDGNNKDEQAKSKKQGGFQKKINKLTGRVNSAEQERDYWKAEALKHSQTTLKKEEAKVENKQAGKPTADQYETHAEYVEALADWKFDQRQQELNVNKQKETALTEAQAKAQSFQAKVDEFVKTKPDYHEVLNECDVEVKQGLIELIKESDIAPLLGYELVKNEEELIRINSLPPRQAAIELLKFEAKLQSSSAQKSEKQEVKTTQASRPLKPIGSASRTNVSDSPYERDMTFAEQKAWEAKQKQK